MINLHGRLFVAICALTCTARASAPTPAWPEGFSVVTIEGTRTYKVLKTGGITGQGGKRLGMGISYATTTRDLAAFKTGGADLFTYILPQAAQEHDDAIAVLAELGWNGSGQPVRFGIVYKLQQDGWHVTPPDDTRPIPLVDRAIDEQAPRDPDAEAKARASVDAWLSLVDAGDVERTWDTAAPLLKTISTKTKWNEYLGGIRRDYGKLASRSLFSTTRTAVVPNAPSGKYLILQFRSHFAERHTAGEKVVAVLCEDGEWRVAGYGVSSGGVLAAKIIVDARPSR